MLTKHTRKMHTLYVEQLRTLLDELQQANTVINNKLLQLEKEKIKAGSKLIKIYLNISDMMFRYLR
jgi:hypothetical protein